MSSRSSLALRIIIFSAIYFLLNNPGTMVQWKVFQVILYPIRTFVIFLHEFGHAFGALITGGSVDSIEIHNRGGTAWTSGGNRAVVIMGGYIGSAFFGNLLFYIGARKPEWVKISIGLIIFTMLITAFLWYRTLFTTGLLCAFAAGLFLIGFKTKFGRDILMFLGLASVLYIIQNFRIGPASDLAAFEREVGFLSAKIWMYIWLIISLVIVALNLKMLFNIKDIEPPTPRRKLNTTRRYNPIKKK